MTTVPTLGAAAAAAAAPSGSVPVGNQSLHPRLPPLQPPLPPLPHPSLLPPLPQPLPLLASSLPLALLHSPVGGHQLLRQLLRRLRLQATHSQVQNERGVPLLRLPLQRRLRGRGDGQRAAAKLISQRR